MTPADSSEPRALAEALGAAVIARTPVAIVGAGPYGLSLAAYLRAAGVPHRIFGHPMTYWSDHMPQGMFLKSDGFASSLFDPDDAFTLEAYCRAEGLPYKDQGEPVPVGRFVAYGRAFQARFAPDLEPRTLTRLRRTSGGYRLGFSDGGEVEADQVVLATGVVAFRHIPEVLGSLEPGQVSHSSDYGPCDGLADRDVLIVGGGASAVDVALDLAAAGARPRVVSRGPLAFHQPPRRRTALQAALRPKTGLGPGWKSFLCVHAPLLFHALPEAFRLEAVRTHLGPAPGWFTKAGFARLPEPVTGVEVIGAETSAGRARLRVRARDGSEQTLDGDHVIAATGYQTDVDRLDYLDDALRAAIRRAGGAPALSRDFETSSPGLFFAGSAAGASFGPLMRFAFGARFAASRISRRLSRDWRRRVRMQAARRGDG